MMRQVYSVVFILLCLAGAAVQYNDPDGLLWAGTYVLGAAIGVLFMLRRMPRWLAFGYAAATTAWAAWLALGVFGNHTFFADPEVEMMGLSEETREMLGLVILATMAMGMGAVKPRVCKAEPGA